MKANKDTRTLKYLGQYEIALGNGTLLFNLRRSLKARLIWLKIGLDGDVTVTIPRSYPAKLVPEYVKKNLAWITRNLEKRSQPVETAGKPVQAKSISYLGRPFELVRERCLVGSEGVTIRADKLIVRNSDPSSGDEILSAWLRREAGQAISARCRNWADRIGVKFKKITLRDQRTRWASCSQKANLSFNWRLIMAPEAVLEYVIIHELCHLKQMNHSRRFWQWVSRFCPDWREHRKWMDIHGRDLRTCLD